MIKDALGRAIEHPRRRLFVIIATFVAALVTVLPLTDVYSEVSIRHDAAAEKLAAIESDISQMDLLKRRVEQRMRELEQEESRAVASRIDGFRGRVVALVRASGCQLRQIDVGASRTRAWVTDDDPLSAKLPRGGRSKKRATPYNLTMQPMKLSISGEMPNIRRVLDQLQQRSLLAHTRHMSLRAAGGRDRKQVTLDLELWLFDLTDKRSAAA